MGATTQQVLEQNALSILATFPGETCDGQTVYGLRDGAPAFVLVREPWNRQAVVQSEFESGQAHRWSRLRIPMDVHAGPAELPELKAFLATART